jgi:hypothetical protein
MSTNGKHQSVSWETVLQGEHEEINKRREILKQKPVADSGHVAGKAYGSTGQFDTAGLALSGGGIRSAAFCLGAMQALSEHEVIPKIDYLSTVSGGGYTGTSVSSAMSLHGGQFPFAGSANDMSDPQALGHIRDHSNYLIPRGKFSFLEDLAIVVRGLVTNLLLVVPVILLAAALTIYLNPTREALSQPYFSNAFLRGSFSITIALALLSLVMYSLWAVYRSVFKLGESEFEGQFIKVGVSLLVLLAASAFCELQPVIVSWMYITIRPADGGEPLDYSVLVKSIVAYLTPMIAVVSLYAKRIGEMLATESKSGSYPAVAKKIFGKAVIWAVALALPIIIWMVYLLFTYWGIPGVGKDQAPSWLWAIWYRLNLPVDLAFPAFAKVYGLIAFAMMILTWPFLDPNANSLHRLYRDRLSDAFLSYKRPDGSLDAREMRLSQLETSLAPYHLINAALNIQGSPEANQRGRNADFFFFGQRFSGSQSSSFQDTGKFESEDNALTLGTAMAISGAAISSNMGSASIGPMAPTLALLNLRLGYWLKNPGGVGMVGLNLLYLLREMFSRLKPRGKWLYLTDGGHIDNTGLYVLLQRRCSHIIVIDAEADPHMTFHSFVKVQRYARIDLGVRINLRWDKIAATSLSARGPDAKHSRGPHCAVGEIIYSDGGKGKLIYVKASLSNDENVYIRDYARRYADYPHETTGDQFFSEEQFEVYRALGFHCVHGIYKSDEPDEIEVSASGVEVKGTVTKPVGRAILLGQAAAVPGLAAKPQGKPRTSRK